VIINKTLLDQDFKQFLNLIKDKVKTNQSLQLASFAFEIPSVSIADIVGSNFFEKVDSFYWNIEDNIEFYGAEPLIVIKEYGEERLSKTSIKINEIAQNHISNFGEAEAADIPLFVGGIKFAPNPKNELWKDYSDSDWFIPKIIFFKKGIYYSVIYNFIFSSNLEKNFTEFSNYLSQIEFIDTDNNYIDHETTFRTRTRSNSFNEWKNIVDEALSKISHGLMSKVVLSREVFAELNQKPFLPLILKKLSKKYPKCYTFAYKKRESVFIGASPEKLAKISNGWIEVDALAGSAPRGRTEGEDLEMENFLLHSEKNLFEQRAVVNFIHNLLNKISDEIIFGDKPLIRKLPNIQHLWTVMHAKLKKDVELFDILIKLHPTPAICGDPWKIAKDFILQKEPHDRGLYSGNIGWFNFSGSGEFAVAIRSALIKENKLYAYAGCGIVEGSEAKTEFEESEIKLKPILSLFDNEKIYQS
jgi:menaquinone-specific isochorismate synthase